MSVLVNWIVQSNCMVKAMKPTESAYLELEKAFDFFNEKLFGGELPNCLITFQRKARTYGYYAASRFMHRGGSTTDEIAMNPSYFSVVPLEEIMQTLVHEMTHQWQEYFGTKGRRGYHNIEWAEKMESIGLMPSSTGKPGGAKTGDQMMDYIIEGGPFQVHLTDLLSQDFAISWSDRHPPIEQIRQMIKEQGIDAVRDKLEAWGITVAEGNEGEEPIITALVPTKPTRIKFTCVSCSANVWGRPSLNILCLDCNTPFTEVF